jgi:hypothetical protein
LRQKKNLRRRNPRFAPKNAVVRRLGLPRKRGTLG